MYTSASTEYLPCRKYQLRFSAILLADKRSYRRDLLWQVHLFLQNQVTLLKRTLQIHILDLVAEVDGLFHQRNQTPFHFQAHGSALLHGLLQNTFSLDVESRATVMVSLGVLCILKRRFAVD